MLSTIAKQISAKHIKSLAIGYLDITIPMYDYILTSNSHNVMNVIISILHTWLINNPHPRQKLHDILQEAGQKEGLVKAMALHVLKGICYITLNFQAILPIFSIFLHKGGP